VIRAFTSIVAGLVRIPPVRFGVLSLIGTVIYVTVLTSIGYGLGSAWTSISHGLAVAGYVIFAAAVVVIIGFVLYRLRQFRRESAQHQNRDSAPAGRDSAPPAGPKRPGKHRSDAEV
jgi:membrane protein DedA with SNARE-associated domain